MDEPSCFSMLCHPMPSHAIPCHPWPYVARRAHGLARHLVFVVLSVRRAHHSLAPSMRASVDDWQGSTQSSERAGETVRVS